MGSSQEAINHIANGGSISVTPELLKEIYLSSHESQDPRRQFGNPTPVALIGLLISLSPLACDLMGWRGSGTYGAAGIAFYFFFGGLLMIMGGVGEWIIGNTFPCLAWTSIGAFWLAFGGTLQPFYGAYGLYATTDSAASGLTTVGFNSSFAFFLLAMALMFFIYFVGSFRLNLTFVMIFFALTCAFGCLAGAFFQISNGNSSLSSDLLTAAGAFAFVACAFGWWLFCAIVLATLNFPFSLPLGDLSRLLEPKSAKENLSKEHAV